MQGSYSIDAEPVCTLLVGFATDTVGLPSRACFCANRAMGGIRWKPSAVGISNMTFFFSVALIVFISKKVENKRKAQTSRSYVFNLCKL